MSGSSIEITDQSAFRHGSLGKQILFAIVTFGLYGVYWWYNTHQQFDQATTGDFDPTVQTVLYLVPLANLYAIWKFSNMADGILDQDGVVLFILFLVFPPAFWYLVQSQINELAGV
jgi:hypothetical protein